VAWEPRGMQGVEEFLWVHVVAVVGMEEVMAQVGLLLPPGRGSRGSCSPDRYARRGRRGGGLQG
jgi:hypothetical protein